ncbi:geranylgeranylglycerol-phosphate geranylgeranyltransferase [Candidatus Poribacteria bacterium]|nr:geranylgeranylglycerol-phosphate geranylgeranyltransferase [Candidatus Poribacteria bacterium]
MKTLIAYVELARPLNGIIAFISAWLGGMFASHGNVENLADIRLLLVSVAALVVISAGNAINDYCDYDIDRINRPRRPLPSGRIRRPNALIFAIVLIVIGIYLGTLININATAIATLVSVALVCYAFWLKRTPFVGNLVVSGLTGLTFIAGGVAIDSVQGTLIPAIFAFLFTTAREIVKDLEDTEGDLKNNVKTLATLNPRMAVWIAVGFMVSVILFSPIPYVLGWYSWHYLIGVLIGVDVVLIGLAIRLCRDASRASCASIQRWMKWDIFIGLGAIYLGF